MRTPWEFQRWAFERQTGHPTRKALLSMLAMMADAETGRCEAKQTTLAAGIEAGERVVRGHLKALEDAGLIARRPQFRRDRGRRGDEFLLLAPWVTEWPDGEPVRGVQPADSAGGGRGRILPGGAVAHDPTPRSPAAAQELPLKNGRLGTESSSTTTAREIEWLDVPDEMRADVAAFLAEKRKCGSRIVTEREWSIAAAGLAEFNRQLGARNELGSWYKEIVERIREHPSYDAAAHVRLVQSAFRLRWWEKNGSSRRARPGVVWGPRAFPSVVDDATREAQVLREREDDLDLRTKTFGGVPWDQLTRAEQENVKIARTMGLRPWESAEAPPVQVNGNGHANGNGRVAITAENWLTEAGA